METHNHSCFEGRSYIVEDNTLHKIFDDPSSCESFQTLVVRLHSILPFKAT